MADYLAEGRIVHLVPAVSASPSFRRTLERLPDEPPVLGARCCGRSQRIGGGYCTSCILNLPSHSAFSAGPPVGLPSFASTSNVCSAAQYRPVLHLPIN